MRAAGWVLPAIVALIPVSGCAASGHDFDAVVSAVETRYPAHVERVPMMGLISFCARVATRDGVKACRWRSLRASAMRLIRRIWIAW